MAASSKAAHIPTPPRWLIPWISRAHVVLYKLTSGRVGGTLAGKPGLLLRTIGARTGTAHTVCLPYLPLDGDRVIVASYAGAPRHPAWFFNLRANPEVIVRDRRQVFLADARILEGAEYADVWAAVVADAPWYADYQSRTERRIPLVRLARTADL